MAIITGRGAFALDFSGGDINSYSDLFLTSRTANYVKGDYRAYGSPNATVEFFGNRFAFSGNGEPIGGNITRIRETTFGVVQVDIQGISVPVATLRYWVTNSLDEESQAFLLRGSDTITAGRFDDFLIGYDGDDVVNAGAGDDDVEGSSGRDTIIGSDGLDTAWYYGTPQEYKIVNWGDLAAVLPLSGSAFTQDGIDKLMSTEQIGFYGTFDVVARGTQNFSPLEYIASHQDLSALIGANSSAGFDHYIYSGFYEGRQTTFSALDYLAVNADLRGAFGANVDAAAAHYIAAGRFEGRQTDFDGLSYIASYPDLVRAYGVDEASGVQHYITSGAREGRAVTFDGLQYIASYSDLISAFGANERSGALHYLASGAREGRSKDRFDAEQYLENYADLRAAFGADVDAATRHYISSGFYEGRNDDAIRAASDFVI